MSKSNANKIIEQISAMEIKLKIMKQFVNPEKNTVNDIDVVSKIFSGVEDHLREINRQLVKFL